MWNLFKNKTNGHSSPPLENETIPHWQRTIESRVKRWKSIYQENRSQNQANNSVMFDTNKIRSDREDPYLLLKETIHKTYNQCNIYINKIIYIYNINKFWT